MDPAEELLRRLVLNDETALAKVLATQHGRSAETNLDPKVELLTQLAAFIAVGAATPLLRETVRRATAEGATEAEIVGVLVAVGPAIGLASLVASAPRLAAALGYDLENGYSRRRGERRQADRAPGG